MKINIEEVRKAKNRLENVIYKNPLSFAPNLSSRAGVKVYLKKENLQLTGAFKIRGAFNKISALREKEVLDLDYLDIKTKKLESTKTIDAKSSILSNGIICASAGNHAQGVAYCANYFNVNSFIVMPEATPLLKVLATKNYGGNVVLKGSNYDEAYSYALELREKNNLTFIHPFADVDVMAGQGTIGLEMIEEEDLDIVIVPVGGGGLISGIASVYKQLKPEVKVIGVNARGANAMTKSFNAKKIINSKSVKTIADGIAVRDVNENIFEYILENVDAMVEVSEEEIASAVLFLLESQKLVVEGAGAACVATLLHNKIDHIVQEVMNIKNMDTQLAKNIKVGLVLSGGNIDVTMLNLIIEKGLLKSDRRMKFQAILVDKPGSLEELTKILSRENANIVQVSYNRVSTKIAYGDASIMIELELKGREHKESVCRVLFENNYKFFEIP